MRDLDPRWRLDAACRGTRPEAWYIHQKPGGAPNVPTWNARLCARCPVLTACAADALNNGDQYVIRAGVPLGQRMPVNREKLTAILAATEGARSA